MSYSSSTDSRRASHAIKINHYKATAVTVCVRGHILQKHAFQNQMPGVFGRSVPLLLKRTVRNEQHAEKTSRGECHKKLSLRSPLEGGRARRKTRAPGCRPLDSRPERRARLLRVESCAGHRAQLLPERLHCAAAKSVHCSRA